MIVLGIGGVWERTVVDWTWTIERVGNTGKMLTPGKTTDARTGSECMEFAFLSRNLVILLTALSTLAGL